MAVVGVDLGSQSTKVVILEGDEVLGGASLATGGSAEAEARMAVVGALKQTGLKREALTAAVSTGTLAVPVTAALNIAALKTRSPASCVATGAHFRFPQARTVLYVGADSSMAIRLSGDGQGEGSVRNERCAVSSGSVVEMPRAGTFRQRGGRIGDYYEISVKQFAQQILPAGLPTTTVWGYGAVRSATKGGLLVHNAPSLTIEAQWKLPVRVKWINELRKDPADPSSAHLPHLLPVDPTLHWANPPGGVSSRDTRPHFTSTPGPYLGPVPMVTHVHGAVGVGDESDGYAEAWYLPQAGDVAAEFATAP